MSIMLMNFTNNTDFISSQFKEFSHRFKVGRLLSDCGAYKQKGVQVMNVFFYLCTILFCGVSMNRDQNTRIHKNLVKKDTCHRFLQSMKTDWNRFLTLLAKAIIIRDFIPLRRKDCEGAEKPFFLVVDDSSFYRNRSKKVELLAKNFDHALRRYFKGFRMLTLAWTDGISVLPLAICNMSANNKKSLVNKAKNLTHKEKGTFGDQIRILAQKKMNDTLLDLLDAVSAVKIQAKYLLCDKWFSNPVTIFSIRAKGYDVICMLKRNKTYYRYHGERKTIKQIFRILVAEDRIQRQLKRKAGKDDSKSRQYLFSTVVELINKNGKDKEVKLVFVRNRNKKSEFLVMLSTDTELTENQIIEYYSCRWGIETMFQTCKSYLRLQKSTQSIDYSEIHASAAIVMFQYAMLSWLNRQNSDEIGFGELFYQLLEEVQDAALFAALELTLTLFVEVIADEYSLPPDRLNDTLNRFLKSLPQRLRIYLENAV